MSDGVNKSLRNLGKLHQKYRIDDEDYRFRIEIKILLCKPH